MSGPKTDSTGQIQKPETKPGDRLVSIVNKMMPEITKAIPKHLSPERMARVISTAIRMNPRLGECTPVSFIGSFLQSAQLGLEVNTPLGHAFLVPFFNKRLTPPAYECQLIVGYTGYLELAYRSKQVMKVIAREVREGDSFDYAYGTDDYIQHIPSNDINREERELTHAYAIVKIKDGDPIFVVLTKAQIEARRARSSSARKGFSPWTTDYAAMARKSAVRALHPYIPQSSELAVAESLERAAEVGETQVLSPEITELLEHQGMVVDYSNGEVPIEDEPKGDLPK